jgi:glycosyltransferase involved in cell wall biosynthesis
MSRFRHLPTLSIVLEWETGEESGGSRAWLCLREINRQIGEAAQLFAAPPELILVHDPSPVARATAAEAASGLSWAGRFELAEPDHALGYYAKKNFGFGRSHGEIVVFVDSDLAPEPGWLEAIAAPFADPAKSVVVGLTHFETRTLYERAMALFWIFETRCAVASLRPTRRLVSNNIAFRRALFAALPFPDRDTYRGPCSELGARLGSLGVTMYEAPGARAAHPAPAGAGAFARRAFRAGRDAAFYARLEGRDRPSAWLDEWRGDLQSVRRRVTARSPSIGASRVARAAALTLGTVYYSIKAAGFATAERASRGASAPAAA